MLHPHCFRCFSKKLDYTGPVGSRDDINRRIIPSVIARSGRYLNRFLSPTYLQKKLPFRKINDPSETLLSFLRPSNSLVSVSYRSLQWLLELTRWPSRACLVRCFQSYRESKKSTGEFNLARRSRDTVTKNGCKP